MTLEKTPSNWDGSVYGIVRESATELMLQPCAERSKVMGAAWLGMVGFVTLLLPFTLLPTLLITVLILAVLSSIAPELQSHWLTAGVIFSLWGAALSIIAILIWKAIEDSGYKTFIFDRIQKQLMINTVTIIGRKVIRTIPFSQIQEAQWQESQHDGISISVFLALSDWKILGLNQAQKIILSSFGVVSSEKTIKTLTAQKHHKELLRSVREALGFSTQQIVDELRRTPEIPTEEELNRQKAEAVFEAKESLKQLAKTIFASQEKKAESLEVLRSKTRNFPDDPQAWEDFAMLLALQKRAVKDEVIQAYRRAETLYFERGEITKAATIAQMIKKFC